MLNAQATALLRHSKLCSTDVALPLFHIGAEAVVLAQPPTDPLTAIRAILAGTFVSDSPVGSLIVLIASPASLKSQIEAKLAEVEKKPRPSSSDWFIASRAIIELFLYGFGRKNGKVYAKSQLLVLLISTPGKVPHCRRPRRTSQDPG